MLALRPSAGRSVVRLTLVAAGIAAGVWGCQGPDAFFRSVDGGVVFGTGGAPGGQLGGAPGGGGTGTGGRGTGGMTGTAGMTGTGGRNGTGGMTGTGGRTGTGGMTGAGGRIGTGGRTGTGGMIVVGTGGTPGTGGVVGGTGGMPGGTGPCAGICDNPIIFTTQNYASGNLGEAPTCHETTANIRSVVCGNFGTKVLSVNGTDLPCTGTHALPTTKLNGGYCFSSTQGTNSYAYFSTFF